MEYGKSSVCGYNGIIARVITRHTAGEDEYGADVKGREV
jgi:predicted amino acid dehydrogenase